MVGPILALAAVVCVWLVCDVCNHYINKRFEHSEAIGKIGDIEKQLGELRSIVDKTNMKNLF